MVTYFNNWIITKQTIFLLIAESIRKLKIIAKP